MKPSKRSIIAGLVGLNVFLLVAMVLSTYSLPEAFAQRAGASSNFISVTCRADNEFDVLYILDLGQRRLMCFVPDRNLKGQMKFGGDRDLGQDFNR